MLKINVLLLLLLVTPVVFADDEGNFTSSEDVQQNLTLAEDVRMDNSSEIEIDEEDDGQIRIPSSSEEAADSEDSTASPYLPLLTRCSSDDDCSSHRACIDRKCLVSPRGFDFLAAVFHSCRSRSDCPPGHRCIISKCFPFRW